MDSNKNFKTFLRDNAMLYGIKDKNYSNPSISRLVEKEKLQQQFLKFLIPLYVYLMSKKKVKFKIPKMKCFI